MLITQAESGALRIELFGSISEWADGAYEQTLARALQAHNGDVQVLINSPGGEITAGLSMHGLLASYRKGKVTTHNIGQAASAAAIVFAAGQERLVSEGAVTMIHRASSGMGGNAEDLAMVARMLEAYDRAQAALFVAVTGQTEDTVRAKLRETAWMTAQDAVDFGLATAVVAADEIAAKAPDLHAPAEQATVPHMDVRARLGLPADATDEQVAAKLDELLAAKPTAAASTETVAKPEPKPEPALADIVREAVAAAVAAALPKPEPAKENLDSHQVAVAAVVDAAIAAGRVTPAARAKAIAACGNSAASLDSMRQLWAVSPAVTPTPVKPTNEPSQGATALTARQKEMAAASGLTDEQWLAARDAVRKV